MTKEIKVNPGSVRHIKLILEKATEELPAPDTVQLDKNQAAKKMTS